MGNARDRRKRIRSKSSQTDSKFPTTYDNAPQSIAPPCSYTYHSPLLHFVTHFGDPLVASRAKKFKFTPSSGSEGRSGQLTVALFSHFHAFSGSSKPAMWWRAKNWRRVCIVVLMPRVVKREHLHNQIIKICIILFFTIRMPHSFTAALPPFFHPTKWKKNTTFKFQFVFLSGERHYSHRYLANSTSVYRSCHSSSINTKWCQYLLANLFLIFDCDAIFKILQHLTINCEKFVYRMILKIVLWDVI